MLLDRAAAARCINLYWERYFRDMLDGNPTQAELHMRQIDALLDEWDDLAPDGDG